MDAEYASVVQAVRDAVTNHVPEGETVLVVSKGDEALLAVPGRAMRHFPGAADGAYLGYYPETDAEAVSRLEAACESGSRYFVVPRTASWWLDHYEALREHLARQRLIASDRDCTLYELSVEPSENNRPARRSPRRADQGALFRLLIPSESPVALFATPEAGVELGRPADVIVPRDGICTRVEFEQASAAGARFVVAPTGLILDGTNARVVTRQRNVCTIYALEAMCRGTRPAPCSSSQPSLPLSRRSRAVRARAVRGTQGLERIEPFLLARVGPNASAPVRPHPGTPLSVLGPQDPNQYFVFRRGRVRHAPADAPEQEPLYDELPRPPPGDGAGRRPLPAHPLPRLPVASGDPEHAAGCAAPLHAPRVLADLPPRRPDAASERRRALTKESPRRCNQCFPDITPATFYMRKRFIQSHLRVVDVFLAPSEFLLQRYIEWGIPGAGSSSTRTAAGHRENRGAKARPVRDRSASSASSRRKGIADHPRGIVALASLSQTVRGRRGKSPLASWRKSRVANSGVPAEFKALVEANAGGNSRRPVPDTGHPPADGERTGWSCLRLGGRTRQWWSRRRSRTDCP